MASHAAELVKVTRWQHGEPPRVGWDCTDGAPRGAPAVAYLVGGVSGLLRRQRPVAIPAGYRGCAARSLDGVEVFMLAGHCGRSWRPCYEAVSRRRCSAAFRSTRRRRRGSSWGRDLGPFSSDAASPSLVRTFPRPPRYLQNDPDLDRDS